LSGRIDRTTRCRAAQVGKGAAAPNDFALMAHAPMVGSGPRGRYPRRLSFKPWDGGSEVAANGGGRTTIHQQMHHNPPANSPRFDGV